MNLFVFFFGAVFILQISSQNGCLDNDNRKYFQGGGTAAHLMLDLWPSLQLEGWEIDRTVLS